MLAVFCRFTFCEIGATNPKETLLQINMHEAMLSVSFMFIYFNYYYDYNLNKKEMKDDA